MANPLTTPNPASPDRARNEAPRLLPGLTPDLEREFETDYYTRIRPTLRVMMPLLAVLFAAWAIRDDVDTGSLRLAAAQDGVPTVFFLAAFALTWVSGFGRFWQPVLAVGGLATSLVSFRAMATFLSAFAATHPASPFGGGASAAASLFFGLQVCLLMICLSTLRLRFRWALALQVGVFGVGVWTFLTHLAAGHGGLTGFLRPVVGIFAAVLLTAVVSEQLAVRAFVAGHLLEEERNDERRQREQMEGKLRVLAQAIGGIVHDLGNPLTVVQMGTDILDLQADAGDVALIHETNGAVRESVQMLNVLRLSLIEQTRVLEGKPIPVDLRPEPLRPILEAGAHFQNPRFAEGRTVSLVGEDLELYADRMRLITVFMNLIGNALKYSDGEGCVVWRTAGDAVLVAVLDQGLAGRGISEEQARQLFVPFGRLEAHAQVEGTGLGLVSARKIVEAHGGEVFVEGHEDGMSDSSPFTTAQARYPSLLAPGFLTAFVVACRAQHPSDTAPETVCRVEGERG